MQNKRITAKCLKAAALAASFVCCFHGMGADGTFQQFEEALPEQRLEGLKTLLERAMTDSSSARMRDLVEEEFEARSLIAQAPQKLSIGGNTTYRKERDFQRTDDSLSDRIYYSLTLSKSLYHWGALEANRSKGELSLQMEELGTFEAYRSLALDIRKRYLALLVAKQDVELSHQSLSFTRNQLDRDRERLKQGAVSSAHVNNLALQVHDIELELLRKENTLQDQLRMLARMIGISSEAIAQELPQEIPEREILTSEAIADLGRLFDEGIEGNAGIRRQSKSVEYYEKDLHIANQRLKPKIGMSIGLTQYDLDERGARRAEEIVYGGVSIQWSIFDGAATKGHKLAAISRIEQVKERFEQAKSDYRFNLERVQRLLALNARILKRDEDAVDRTRSYFERTKREYDSGIASFEHFGAVERSLASQEIRTHRSRAEYYNSLAEMLSLLGLDPFAQQFIEFRSN